MRINGMRFQHDGFEMQFKPIEIDDDLISICPMNSPEEFIQGELRPYIDLFWREYLLHKENRERR